jgi:hypothetical protein
VEVLEGIAYWVLAAAGLAMTVPEVVARPAEVVLSSASVAGVVRTGQVDAVEELEVVKIEHRHVRIGRERASLERTFRGLEDPVPWVGTRQSGLGSFEDVAVAVSVQ